MNVNECKYLLLNLKFETFMLWFFFLYVYMSFLILFNTTIINNLEINHNFFFFKVMTLKKYKQVLKSLFLILDE